MVLVCVLLGTPSRGAAEVAHSTFGPGNSYDTFSGATIAGPTSPVPQALAQQFVPSTSVYLDSVELALSRNLGNAQVSVTVFADNAGTPSSELATVNVNGFPNGIVVANFNSGLVLGSGTSYWLGVFTAGGNELTWHDSLQAGFAQQGYSANGGASWATGSSDPFPPAAVRVNGSLAVPPDLSFIQAGQAWRLSRGLAEPSVGTAWTAANFNDAGWDFGLDGFGYDANPLTQAGLMSLVQTPLTDMPDNGVNPNAFTTLYLRRGFDVADPAEVAQLILQLDYDDSFVAYINGVEVARSAFGTPGVPEEFDALGAIHESTNGDPNKAPGRFTIDLIDDFPGLLQPGSNNVLAIHGLNVTLDDDDFLLAQISLDARMAALDGDVNYDGVVNIFDLNLVSTHWGEAGPTGDANGDGAVNIFDVNLISSNWTVAGGGGGAAVPEPSTWVLLSTGLGALGWTARTVRREARLKLRGYARSVTTHGRNRSRDNRGLVHFSAR